MVALEATEAEVTPLLGPDVSLAAINAATSVVVSGEASAVDEIVAQFADRRSRRLRVSHAFHSSLMEPMLAEFEAVAEQAAFAPARIAIVPMMVPGSAVDTPEYWVRQVREPVRFADAVAQMRADGVTRFVEAGPGAALCALIAQAADDDSEIVTAAPLHGEQQEESLATALASLYVSGLSVQWKQWFAGTGAHRVDLPTYPFQHQRYWPPSSGRPE